MTNIHIMTNIFCEVSKQLTLAARPSFLVIGWYF